MLLDNLRVNCSIQISHYVITALDLGQYTVLSLETNESKLYSSIWMILWANRKEVNAAIKSGAFDAYLAPAPVAQEEQEQAPEESSTALALVPVPEASSTMIRHFTLADLVPTSNCSWLLANPIETIAIRKSGSEFTAMIATSGTVIDFAEDLPVLLSVLSFMLALPAPVAQEQEEPIINLSQEAYDWATWQEEQEAPAPVAQAQLNFFQDFKFAGDLELERDLFDDLESTGTYDQIAWVPVPEVKQSDLQALASSYAMHTGTSGPQASTAALPFQVPDHFRLIAWQEEPSLIERLLIAGDAFDAWQEDHLSLFATPAVCAISYLGMLFTLAYLIFTR